MGIFERYLSVWVALAMGAGIGAGLLQPELFETIGTLQIGGINLVIALLIWSMIYPMMVQVEFTEVRNCFVKPKGLIVTLAMNWLVKPFTMAALAILFMRYVFASWISPDLANQYIAGMILLGVAPCTAMVFVWSYLTKGNASYTVAQVATNDLIMIFAFAPLAAFLLGVSDIIVPWDVLLVSTGLFVALPLGAGWLTRLAFKNDAHLVSFSSGMKPFSIVGLVGTVFLLFGLQANNIIAAPADIVLIAIPLLIQTALIFFITYIWMKKWRQPHNVAAPGAMIGASNFFELAVAVAISLFGVTSGAALATIVGVLVEVPVMLALVSYANKTRGQFSEDEVEGKTEIQSH
ncbi:ACR3 family arsenite efflux transporter [Pseudovibrio sp. Tun.PSC04-5.I4]|uniref:ACR3 family arsenite efflux transporter n=1 Tax=Pseudovibrio sp. Tun.PSC04-5.I4 TaxID=1798213 RepID=UPI000886587C|nr:ACR3 family arsenite efflux transporter [Pseudovibrio sp. Tun.PSC04-5.I4]SDR47422.1 arsenite transporter, ACR3 family [Pseudovibrio sp. Tun.PSC04-5.I4]